jgi:hypothetical protein
MDYLEKVIRDKFLEHLKALEKNVKKYELYDYGLFEFMNKNGYRLLREEGLEWLKKTSILVQEEVLVHREFKAFINDYYEGTLPEWFIKKYGLKNNN